MTIGNVVFCDLSTARKIPFYDVAVCMIMSNFGLLIKCEKVRSTG